MIEIPQAVWFTSGTPQGVQQEVKNTVQRAAGKGTVPVLVAYNVPGRDCSQYSAGGAATGDAYKAWIDGFAAGLGDHQVVVILEPDGLALMPTDCGQPDTYDRVGLINLRRACPAARSERRHLSRRRPQRLAFGGRHGFSIGRRRRAGCPGLFPERLELPGDGSRSQIWDLDLRVHRLRQQS